MSIGRTATWDPNGELQPSEDPISFVKRLEDSFPQDLEISEALALVADRDGIIERLNLQISALNDELVAMATMLHQREAAIDELKRRLAQVTRPPPLVQNPSSAQGNCDGPPSADARLTASSRADGKLDGSASGDAGFHAPSPPEVVTQNPKEQSPPVDAAYPTFQRVAVSLQRPVSSAQDSVPPSRRRDPRRACEIELEFTEDTHFYSGITQDMSVGGVFVATYHLFPVGTRLDLAFELPGKVLVNARGQVRWLRDAAPGASRPGMGVAFTDLSDEALAAVARFCRQRAPLYVEI